MFSKRGDKAVLAKLAEAPEPYRDDARRLHEIVRNNAPGLQPVVRWGLVFYTRDGTDVCYIKPDKEYLAFGFSEVLNPAHEAGAHMHPVAWTITALDAATEETISALVREAAG